MERHHIIYRKTVYIYLFLLLGHGAILQISIISVEPEHLLPPLRGLGLLHCRFFRWLPVPQIAGHPDHADQSPQPPSPK